MFDMSRIFRMMRSRIWRAFAILLFCGTLAACESTEERAEQYYESALDLLEDGDRNRAMVELRNVFSLDPDHRGARTTMAQILFEKGDLRGAYSNYLVVAEKHPDDLDARITLSEIAFRIRNWDEFERHSEVVAEASPDTPRGRLILLVRQYREAVLDEDAPAQEALIAQAQDLRAELPQSAFLSEILVDGYTRSGRHDDALAVVDTMIERDADNPDLHKRRIEILARLGDISAVEQGLKTLTERFPDDLEAKQQLMRLYLSRQDFESAETFLRELADPTAEDPQFFVDLVLFLAEVKGVDAARAELDRGIAQSPNPDRFVAMRAVFDFSSGQQDQAITALEGLLADAEPSDQTNDIRVMLANMLDARDNEVGARRQVEMVLAADSDHVGALKKQAEWQIEGDSPDAAIANLRLALDAAPEDVEAMRLMVDAYTRAGNNTLARDFLSLAVDTSNNAPDLSLRMARDLIREERYSSAEDVLLESLRGHEDNVTLLAALGQLYIRMEDLARAEQAADTLRRIGTEQTERIANQLNAGILSARQGNEEAIRFIEELATSEDADLSSKLDLLRARLVSGDVDGAVSYAQELLAEAPDNESLRFALATAHTAAGDLEAAEDAYRRLVETNPERPRVWLELSRVLIRKGDLDASRQAIEGGLAAVPQSTDLLWAKASILEREQDIDGAIEIYEQLYQQNSGSVIIANNLASLLSTYRDDEADLERAWNIARRLRDADVPALQDTYGWIVYRRGNPEEALPYLQQAAEGLPDDPIVQAHLGTALAALERNEEALSAFQRAVELAGSADTRPQIETARAEISRLRRERQSD